MSNGPIKIEKLDRPAPPEISAILDGLDLLTRNVLIARLNNLTNGNSPNTRDFEWGACVGYADALMLTGTIDAYAQSDIATYARILAHPGQQYQFVPKTGQ